MYRFFAASLMLATSILSTLSMASARLVHVPLHQKIPNLAGRDQLSTPTASIILNSTIFSASSACGEANGTMFTGVNSTWTLLCDTDYFAQDLLPFMLAKSFDKCMQFCEDHNNDNNRVECAGFVYAPGRSDLENDCYLKSALNNPIYPATIHLIGALLGSATTTSTTIQPIPTALETSTMTTSVPDSTITPSQTSTQLTQGTASGGEYSAQTPSLQGQMPTVTNNTYLGTSVDEVASEYVSHAPAKPQQLAADVLEAGVNINLINGYPLASDTGSWTSSDVPDHDLANMTIAPRLSRDGGRGGNVNGTNIFIFCDTSTYGEVKDPVFGYLNGFVSSSIAVDESMNGLDNEPLTLVNSLGQWQDDVGRMRGWVPMTTGEEAFNTAVSGQGYRYAIWPNSSPLSLNSTHAIIYAPLVYLQLDMHDQSSANYTSLGNTLLRIIIDPVYGPHADRLSNQFFTQSEVSWGSLGGVRAWSSNGRDSTDGSIYVFGQTDKGVLLGKVAATTFDDRDNYTYWNGTSWSDEQPSADAPEALMIDQPVMCMDVIYSPAHKTFIMIYLTPLADNTFYYRYLVDKDNSSLSIIPPYEQGGDDNYAENLVTNTWSEEKVLFRVPTPARGFVYAGGLHAGYFAEADITNGGTKMLCTWTEHTQVDPDVPESGYAHKSQIIEFGFE